MEIYNRRQNQWRKCLDLWEALGLDERIGSKKGGPYVISLAGAGGKTSYIRCLAAESMGRGLKTLVVTTTHMQVPTRFGISARDKAAVKAMLDRESIAVAGEMAGDGKIKFTGSGFYEEICPLAALVLVEADGSRRLPIKVPGHGEPVIPDNSDMILCLTGMSVLGSPAGTRCLRIDKAREIMDLYGRKGYMDAGEWLIHREDIPCLLQHGYLLPLRNQYPSLDVIPVFNQADTASQVESAKNMADMVEADSVIVSGLLHMEEAGELF